MPYSKFDERFDANLLQSLQPAKHLELLNVIDNLRAQGLNDHVDLPQLIVCGDQSSGKSSVLAAISGVPFPKRDNLCTRFATEVILRRHDDIGTVHISASITSGGFRSSTHHAPMDNFRHDLESMDQLPEVLEKAALAMGVGSTGSAFSSKILRLEVRGPRMPQLTIVDLPGLIHSENKYQSGDDIKLVSELVEYYMAQERSIILAVISAKNDYANQIVLTKARKVDPDGRRTLGIITKPDTLFHGSVSESSFLNLAKNQDVHFSLGWHVVRNQDSNQPLEGDRDELESAFFERKSWAGVAKQDLGIVSLRHRLSEVLFEQITKELPAMISEIDVSIEKTTTALARMGRSRTTELEKRLFMMELAQSYSSLCHAACEALYDNPFFAERDHTDTQPRRLRAIVQNANMSFAEKMLEIPIRIAPNVHPVANSGRSDPLVKNIVARAKALISSHRGKELPGTFNPLLIGPLFRELSQSWPSRAQTHVEDMWLQARTTVIAILDEIAETSVRVACMEAIIGPKLEEMRSALEERLKTYMHEYLQQPITYNHYLTENVYTARLERRREEALSMCRNVIDQYGSINVHNIELVIPALVGDRQPDMDDLAAQDLADYAQAYYKVALKRVIDEIPAHVIEPVILSQLPSFLNSSEILKMPQTTIDSVAEESGDRKAHRTMLRSKLDVLKRSSLLCKLYIENSGSLRVQDAASQHMEQMSSNDLTHEGTPEEENSIPGAGVEVSQEAQEVLCAPDIPDDIPAESAEVTAEPSKDVWAMPATVKKDKKKKKKSTLSGFVEAPES